MNWFVFALATWIIFGLELGLRDVLGLGQSDIAPSFVIPLAVFVGLSATPMAVLWSFTILGLLVDLTWIVAVEPGARPATIIGPSAIGYYVAGHLVLALRGMMIRGNPLTAVFLSILSGLLIALVVVAFHTVRMLYGDPIAWSPGPELLHRFGVALYTGVLALVMSILLHPFNALFSFQASGRGGRH